MRLLGIVFVFVCLLGSGSLVAWEKFTLERIGGTTREVRFLGFGTEPGICMRRLRTNFEEIEQSIDAIADAMNEAPVLDHSIYYPDLNRLSLDPVTTELSDRDTRLKAAWVALHDTENAYRPWQFYRAEDRSIRTDTYIVCGQTTTAWIRSFFPSIATSPKEGDILARLAFIAGEPPQSLPSCGAEKPDLDENFAAICVAELNERWYVQQNWEDRCSAYNAAGWSFFKGAGDSEETAELEKLIAEGLTPCEALIQRSGFFG